MRNKGNLIFFLFLVLAATADPWEVHGQDSARTLSLDDCISIGQSKATEILKDRNTVSSAGAQVLEAYGQFLPNLSMDASLGYTGGNQYLTVAAPTLVQTQRSALDYQLQSSVNIFNGFSNLASLRAAVLGRKAADLSLDRAKQDIALDITQSFLQVILDKQVLEYAGHNLGTSDQRESQLQALTATGRNALSDLYQQQAQTSSDKLLFINAGTKLRNDQLQLEQKLKLDLSINYNFTGPDPGSMQVDTPRYDLGALLDTALGNRADLQAAGYATQEADWQTRKYQGAYWPQISLLAGIYDNSSYLYRQYVNGENTVPANQKSLGGQIPDQLYAGIGLDLHWNIFTGYYNRLNVANARIYATNLGIDYQDLRLEIISGIRQAYGNYQDALQQLETSQKGLLAAQKSYETLNGRYQLGATDFITLINAQTILLQSEVNRAQALVNLLLQQKTIEYYTGK
jgi:outer membrane protein